MAFNFSGGSNAGGKKGFSLKPGAVPDPLADVEYENDLAVDAAKEMTALQKGFKDRATAERDRFRKATDSEFWFAVCFESREEKEKFLRAAGVKAKLMGDKYIDGKQLAKILGVKME
ncbi:hypothetical protein ACXM2N_03455 [Corynebacterium sp. ZY180755]